ncbi:hypothetical protein KQI68_06695 [Peptoniphilus sp. MSJ-1]|uniref:IrrE N-terminal-like domain-containing protein n=1 Tax=Peptoniphilus ovalis TaxID=2841503 RepID=A0ABS6FJU1_9FIRM|nr:hypothetical protein [Peptoniphilus ovalis]MBU5669526.1 hypothetical protein [Peptoniphilus ovalis]
MHIRVKRTDNLDLNKALDRRNLVLVDVMVNGRSGSYKSKRWKNPTTALNIAKNDIRKQAKNIGKDEEIKFKDKNTGEVIKDKEVTKKYLSNNDKNLTLQAYIAENYQTIVDGKKTENAGKNKSENTVVEDKTPASNVNKNQVQRVYSRNVYRKQQFTGTFSCGHEDVITIGGYTYEYRKNQLENELKNECPHCRQKKIDEQRAIEREKAKGVAKELNLPELKGSEKQINWAISIRDKAIDELKPYMSRVDEILEKNPDNLVAKVLSETMKSYLKTDSSEYWINTRDRQHILICKDLVQAYSKNTRIQYEELPRGIRDKRKFVFNIENIKDLKNEKANENRDEAIYYLNETTENYLRLINKKIEGEEYNEYQIARTEEREQMLPKIVGYQKHIENNKDEYFWSVQKWFLKPEDYELQPSLNGSEEVGENGELNPDLLKAYETRAHYVWEMTKKKGKKYEKGETDSITDEAEQILTNFFKGIKDPSIYNNIGSELPFNDFVDLVKTIHEEQQKIVNKSLEKPKKYNWYAQIRFGTKKIESQSEHKQVKTFTELNQNLSNLKGMHTDLVGRAALDMAGLDIPLYVKRNGKTFTLGRRSCNGFCNRNIVSGEPLEIDVVDRPRDRAQSYKTVIHETMHALLGLTKSKKDSKPIITKMPIRFEEGLVEVIACTSLKKAYGKEYIKNDRSSYKLYVVDTLLRLKKTRRFKGQTLSQIGETIGAAAFTKDSKLLESVNNALLKSFKNGDTIYELAKDYDNVETMERAAKRDYSEKNNGDMTHFEETEMAKLVDRIKNTDFTLEEALNNSATMGAAVALLYSILDEEDDEILGLL